MLDRDPSPSPKRGQFPQFSAHGYCGQTARWIKMPLVTEVGHGLGHIVLDWDPAPPRQRGRAPNFRPMAVVAKKTGWVKMPLDREVDSSPGDTVLDGDSPPPKGHSPHPNFRPTSVVAKWLDGSRIKMPLGTRRHCVSSPRTQLPQSHKPPIFGLCLLRLDGSRCLLEPS